MQVCHAAAAAAAAQALACGDRGAVISDALDEIVRVQHELMLATAANGDERHLGVDELLAERPAKGSFPRAAVAGAHSAITRSCHLGPVDSGAIRFALGLVALVFSPPPASRRSASIIFTTLAGRAAGFSFGVGSPACFERIDSIMF